MNNSLNSVVDSASSILILLPKRPYFDQVAAGLSLYLSIRQKKEAAISCPSPMLVEFNRLVGVNKITAEPGNKNLVIKFVDYKADNIERVSYDIENSEFRLTVIPKPGLSSPKKDQVTLSYSGISADTVIIVGGLDESHFPLLSSKDLAGVKIVHVGTREITFPQEREIISFARPASSVSEVVAFLIKESNFPLDEDIATNLLMGIEKGSKGFSVREVTADTFEIVAELMREGGRRAKEVEEREYPTGSIPGQKVEPQENPPKDWLEPKIYKGTTVS